MTATVTVTDHIATGLAVLTPTLSGGATYDGPQNCIEYSGTLPPGFGHDLRFAVQVGTLLSGTVVSNEARIEDRTGVTVTRAITFTVTSDCNYPVTAVHIDGPASGVVGSTTFSATITPTNATLPVIYSWDNGDVTAQSVRTLDVGAHTLVVSATSCGGTVSATHTINVALVALEPGSLTVYQAQSASYTVSVGAAPAFTLPVTLATEGLEGVAYALSPNPVSPGGTATLAVTTVLPTPSASYPFTVTASSSGVTGTARATLTVVTTSHLDESDASTADVSVSKPAIVVCARFVPGPHHAIRPCASSSSHWASSWSTCGFDSAGTSLKSQDAKGAKSTRTASNYSVWPAS